MERLSVPAHRGEPLLTVNAYAAPSATEPLVRTTIERRDVGAKDVLIDIRYAGICHSDIHTVRGEWGEVAYPLTVGHEIVGVVAEVGAEVTKHAVGRPGRGRLHGQLLPRVRQLPGGRGAVLPEGQRRDVRRRRPRRHRSPRAATPPTSWWTRTSSCGSRRAIPYEAAAPLLCAGITTYSPLRALEGRPRQAGRRGRARRSRAHGRQDRRTRWAPRSPCSRSRCASRRTACGWAPSTTTRPATRRPSRSSRNGFDLIVNTVSARDRRGRLPGPARPRRHHGQRRAPRRSRCRSTCSRCSATGARSPAPASAASARPRRCSTSAPSTASPPTSR